MATKRTQPRSKYADVVKVSEPSDVIMTPPHIAQLMAKLANPQPNSVILDPTCGDGKLLAACPQGKLIGVEQEEAPLSDCRKKLPGAHLYFGDSFANETVIRSHRPTIVLTNPPYSKCGKEKVSFANIFMDFGLNCLQPGGILIGLVPISCGVTQHAYKAKLMERHTLKAVMTMPIELFEPEVKVHTLLMVWEAHRPHDMTKPVWFASWQDDGVKNRKKAQETISAEWAVREQKWLKMYRQQKEIPGESLSRCVSPSDEWCLKAHLKTDYTKLKPHLFFEALVNNLAYSAGGNPDIFRDVRVSNEMPLDPDQWREFNCMELFEARCGSYNEKLDDLRVTYSAGFFSVVTASVRNNGAARYTQEPPNFAGHRITMARKTDYSGYSFYQQIPFHATGGANVLTPMFPVTPLGSLFLTVVMSLMSSHYSYSRQVSLERLKRISIRLPANAKGQPDCQYMDTYMRRLRIASPN